MPSFIERPYCRNRLLKICERENVSVEQLLEENRVYLSKNMLSQAKRMIWESRKYVLTEGNEK